jgi:ATP phosphoribosyltransferase regulatory subunit HisZ
MSRNGIILAALGGAAVAVLLANYLSTDKGKQMVNNLGEILKDVAAKATEYTKTNLGKAYTQSDSNQN